jgi:Cdc6-like AAA superfamily ATPase
MEVFYMKIVTLSGKGGCGKSTALREVIRQLLEKYPNAHIVRKWPEREFWKQNGSKKASDGWIVLEISVDGKVTKVAVATDGDTEEIVKKHLENLSACDILFCATKQGGDTVALLQHEVEKGNIVLPFFKPIYDDIGYAERVAQIVIAWVGL